MSPHDTSPYGSIHNTYGDRVSAEYERDRYRIALQDLVARGLEAIHDHGGELTSDLRNEIERGARTLEAGR